MAISDKRWSPCCEKNGWEVSSYPYGGLLLECDDFERHGVIISAFYTPYVGGLELLDRLVKQKAGIPTILIDENRDADKEVRAMKLGAMRCLFKTTALDSLVEVVREALKVAPRLTEDERFKNNLQRLSPRELEVLEFICQGLTSKEISERLGVSMKAVSTNRARIRSKMGIHVMSKIIRRFMKVRQTSDE